MNTRRFADALTKGGRRVFYCDVGARFGVARPWSEAREFLHVVAFEPDAEEAKRLRAAADGQTIIESALWDQPGTVSLNITRSPGSSSVLLPNHRFLSEFPDAERFTVEKTVAVKTTTLDAIDREQVPHVDFLKIDTQGAEERVLRGGMQRIRREVVGLEVEVAFAPLYQGQAEFADIDRLLRAECGFHLWDLRFTRWKYRAGIRVGAAKGRVVFGDALYFRPVDAVAAWLAELDQKERGQKLGALALSAGLYGYADYVLAVLGDPGIVKVAGEDAANRYRVATELYGGRAPRRSFPRAYQLLQMVSSWTQPAHGGWATTSSPLGSRKRGSWWIG
jgi:FkbM family methyltransferase